MQVINGTTDVTTYFVLRDSVNHEPDATVTITDIDLYYLVECDTMAAKVDATALAAADSAHGDNKAFHCGLGLYRVDWPDVFDGGIGTKVYLIVVCTDIDTAFLEVDLVADTPTAIENADAVLTRDWTSVTGEAARSVLNALRAIRNKVSVSGSTLTVTEEDDSTSAWTATVAATEGADPITTIDPD